MENTKRKAMSSGVSESSSPKRARKSCGGKAPPGILTEVTPNTRHRTYDKVLAANEANALHNFNFALQVAKRVLQDALTSPKRGNVMCSPLSITAMLNILAAGASGGLLTQLLGLLECDNVEEVNMAASRLMEVLKGSNDEDAPDICFANALWVDEQFPLKALFRDILRDVHKVEARMVDFQNQADEVVKEANLWAEEQTKGLIKQMLSKNDISQDTKMILANALYFKGVWVNTFKQKETKDKDFYLLNGDKIRTPFMTEHQRHFEYGTFEDCEVLRMLYREGEDVEASDKPRSFSMYIFLPNKKNGLPILIENVKMDSNMFKDQIKLKTERISKLFIPKFNFECEFPLVETMEKLGLTLPFSKDCEELSEMAESPNGDRPYVNRIVQKCRIEVNEKGTKAAAFTRVGLATKAARFIKPPPPINFVADHPFMFMIREDFSGAILYVGTVLDPRST